MCDTRTRLRRRSSSSASLAKKESSAREAHVAASLVGAGEALVQLSIKGVIRRSVGARAVHRGGSGGGATVGGVSTRARFAPGSGPEVREATGALDG
jgi:hypothetical protein